MDCYERYRRLYRRIDAGTSRFRVAATTTRLRQNMARYRSECRGGVSSDFLEAFFNLKFESAGVQETASAMRVITARKRVAPFVKLDALYLLARITLHVESLVDNESYRQRALDIAEQQGWNLSAFRVLVNWAFALIESGALDKAENKVKEAEAALNKLTKSELRLQETIFLRSRLLAHKAKCLILGARTPNSAAEAIYKATQIYNEAIKLVQQNDHLRVNQQIEICEYIVKSYEQFHLPPELESAFGQVELTMSEAQRSLDAHNCNNCRAYFGEVYSRYLFLKGKHILSSSPKAAEELWDKAIIYANESVAVFESVGHIEAELPKQTLIDIASEKANRPKKVFLSHSSKDKPLVREFKSILETLHYEPWLDEHALKAGDKLERGLHTAMQDSCAVVFFLTENFRDIKYLETEVDYAITEKRRRGNMFQIITLVFKNSDGKPADVPDLLQPYVYKHVDSLLEGLRHIIESLPYEPGAPTLKK